jgi:type III pantothenate kinase
VTPDVVVDIGNTRFKWGRCRYGEPGILTALAVPDDSAAWNQAHTEWDLPGNAVWAISSVNPDRCERLSAWIRERGGTPFVFEHHSQLNLSIKANIPESVGFDRLFNIIAVRALVEPGACAIVADIGTAVTVDLLDCDGAFAGGSIFPGLRLMAKALHDYTAKLPLVEPVPQAPLTVGLTTETAIQLGIFGALAGGVDTLVNGLAASCPKSPSVYLTGGDATRVKNALTTGMNFRFHVRPLLTLEGIRLAAEALP